MQSQPAVPERIIGSGAAADISAPLERHGLGKKLVLVCDDTTWAALGERLFNTHSGRYDITTHSLGRYPKAQMAHMPALMAAIAGADGVLAVGAGTVNDVAKYAASESNKPYITLPTAASMNGYTSGAASIENDGFKQSYLARSPKAVIADMDILIRAPRKLSRAGLGDTLARSTTEADSLLSHLLFGTLYPREGFDCLRKHESYLLPNAAKLTQADPEYMHALLTTLLDAGDWMASTGSSAIASQGEHMIAHTAEMMYGDELRNAYHGELVAVTTVAMGYLQQKMMVGAVHVKALSLNEERFVRLFGRKLGPLLAPVYARKLLTSEQAADINLRLSTEWPQMKSALQKIMKSPITVERALTQANLPLLPSHVGLSEDRFTSAMTYAHLTRDRFTFLDLSAMTGKRLSTDLTRDGVR